MVGALELKTSPVTAVKIVVHRTVHGSVHHDWNAACPDSLGGSSSAHA